MIKSVGVKPNDTIIKEVEELLEEAKSGRLQGLAVACILSGGEFATGFEAGDAPILSLLGAAEILKQEIAHIGVEWDND